MDSAVVVLAVGIMLVACGSLALLTVRLTSPSLLGTGRLSAAFAFGAASGALILVPHYPLLSVFAADFTLLLSFVLLQMAVSRLLRDADVVGPLGCVILGVQPLVDLLCMAGFTAPKLRVISIGILVAAQTGATAWTLWRSPRPESRAPAIFSIVILTAFAAFNLFRSCVELLTYHGGVHSQLKLLSFALYLAIALGTAFGFFWMTTSALTGELEHMASTDPLTRLFNRRIFLKWCERELLRCGRSGAPFSLLMIDLDHFKRVNDEFGHHVGDQVLCAAVEQMQDSIRGLDVLCRWGGEEFAVLLPNAPCEATRIVAERILENIQKVTLPLSTFSPEAIESFCLTASIGTATYRGLEDGIASMLQRADEALYAAKKAGRNRVLETA